MLKNLFIATTLATGCLLVTSNQAQAADRTECGIEEDGPTGTFNNRFWTWYKVTDNRSGNCIRLRERDNGSFRANWNINEVGHDVVGGMGWDKGERDRVIKYRLNRMTSTGKASVGLYGWTCSRNLIEYYVVDSWGDERYVPFDPDRNGNAVSAGTVVTDGATYDLYRTRRYNAGNACGAPTDFWQNWSVRRSKAPNQSNRTITVRNHITAWANQRWWLGDFDSYQVIAAEGLNQANGFADIGFVNE